MAVAEAILSGSTTLLRATFVGVVVSIVLITASYIPPFPPQFGQFLETMFGYVLGLDGIFPAKLAVSLWLANLTIDGAISVWLWLTWFKDWLMGRPGAGTIV